MPERVDFFFSFRSPYSYLAGPRAFSDEIRKIEEVTGRDLSAWRKV